jgi:cytoplasmic iron level regulating protein YaaA (DUF328/UPF0246 family)
MRNKMAITIALVACVSKKNKRPMQARDLYISDWFKKASAYAEKVSDEWFILSAKYGLIDPNVIIEPYNVTLNKIPISERRTWSIRVMQDLRPILKKGDHIVILAGQKYREFLVEPLRSAGCQVDVPMEGLRIGEQLSWLSKQAR